MRRRRRAGRGPRGRACFGTAGDMRRLLMPSLALPLLLLLAATALAAGGEEEDAEAEAGSEPPPAEGDRRVLFKCCELGELWLHEHGCVNASEWLPPDRPVPAGWPADLRDGQFGRVQVGQPQCASTQLWPLFHYEGSHDELQLLVSGRLRHYTRSHAPPDHPDLRYDRARPDPRRPGPALPPPWQRTALDDLQAAEEARAEREGVRFYHDYAPGSYCIDQIMGEKFGPQAQYAVVCAPQLQTTFNSTDVVMRRVVNPACHGVAIACYLLVAVLYFVLPQLRDLVGNMLTTLATCLIVSQAADLVRIFTQFSSHVSFLVADIVMYVSLLGAFFWLNSLGYYIWKTFRSRNVFLRVTDARKYCYYSCYAWGATGAMAAIALFAHFMLDTKESTVPSPGGQQETIGRLGVAVFFTPIAFTILVNIFFYLTTGQAISRISTRGRIHHKMKYCFDMFVKLFLVMAVAWLFLVLSWLPYDVLAYCNIIVNLLQALFFLYITVLGQKRVTSLVKQAFCTSGEGHDAAEWGEEMSPMSSAHY